MLKKYWSIRFSIKELVFLFTVSDRVFFFCFFFWQYKPSLYYSFSLFFFLKKYLKYKIHRQDRGQDRVKVPGQACYKMSVVERKSAIWWPLKSDLISAWLFISHSQTGHLSEVNFVPVINASAFNILIRLC